MTRLRQRSARERRGLSEDECTHLLGSAVPEHESPFSSEAERREAWQRHRDDLMSHRRLPGTRPQGWWDYESSAPAELREPAPFYGWLDNPKAEQPRARAEQREREDRRLAYLASIGELTAELERKFPLQPRLHPN